jgi:RNA polymerase sigma-70 factor (family 1)
MALLDSETELDIIARLKRGDEKAMAPIFRLFHKSLCWFARKLVNSEEQAEDIVADTFLKLWQKRNDFDSLAAIRGFMYVAIRNASYDYLKHVQRKTASHIEILHMADKDEEYIEAQMIKADLLQSIMHEIGCLPPIRRKIFELIYLKDFTIFEIATQLNITVDTVRVQKARAIQNLRSAILKKGILIVVSTIGAGLHSTQL